MANIRFSAQAGKTFSVQAYNATTGAAIGSPVAAVVDTTTPTLYNATLAGSGIVYLVATATNLRVAGYANLDQADASGSSAVYGSYNEAAVAIPEVEVDEDAVALGVYRRLAGASIAMLRQPTEDDELEAVNSVDFVETLDIATAADSEIVFTVRKCVDDDAAQLEVTLSGGLVTVAGDAWDDAGDGSVTRDSSTAVTLRVAAAAMSELRPGVAYACEVREILAGGAVEGRSEFTLHVRRSAGRRVAA